MSQKKESSYSRIYQHTQDDSTFAIIGSQDKDTFEDRSKELYDLIRKCSYSGKRIGFNRVEGTYTYQEDGKTGMVAFEKSVIVYNIDKDTALYIAKELNQESIVWKDKDFFGIIYTDGSVMVEFDNQVGKNMSFSDAEVSGFGTKLPKDKNSIYGFVFEGKVYYPNINAKEYTVEDFSFNVKEK